MEGNIKIVIGSWGSYNECNERALGSKWLDLSDFDEWQEIVDELENEGFELDGIDEELFIQDIEGIPSDCKNWDYTNPQTLFETLYNSGVLNNNYKYDEMTAYLEVRSYEEFEELVNSKGEDWDENICLYKNYNWEDFGHEMFSTCGYDNDIPEHLQDFFDFEAYGRYIADCSAEEYSEGIIVFY